MGNFEDRLIGELMDEHGPALAVLERPEPRRRSNRPLWMTGGALAVALAVAGVLTFATGSSSPAYAVTRNPDGTVTLTVSDVTGVDGANAELRRLGLPVRVVRVEDKCPDRYQATPVPVELGDMLREPTRLTFSLRDIPRGETLVVGGTVQTIKGGSHTVQAFSFAGSGLVAGTPPTCTRPEPSMAGISTGH